jgi:hypothetical protein
VFGTFIAQHKGNTHKITADRHNKLSKYTVLLESAMTNDVWLMINAKNVCMQGTVIEVHCIGATAGFRNPEVSQINTQSFSMSPTVH